MLVINEASFQERNAKHEGSKPVHLIGPVRAFFVAGCRFFISGYPCCGLLLLRVASAIGLCEADYTEPRS